MDSPFPYVKNLFRFWFRKKKQVPIRRKPAGTKPLFDILEDRIVPVTGISQVTLNVGSVATPASTITGSPSNIIPVFIDFDNQTAAGTIMGNDSVVFPTTNPNVDTITRNSTGSVTFKYNGISATGALALSATTPANSGTGNIQTNLRTIPALASVTVSGGAGGPYTVTFPSGVDPTLLTVTLGTGNATVTTVNCTFSYNGSQGPALGFPSTPTAAQFQTYLQSVPGLSGSAISGVSGSGTSASPFLITFGNGINGGSLLTSNNSAVAITGGSLASASIYVLYDPSVLSINETSTALGSDIKASSLLNSSSGYTLQVASGFATGVAAIGLTHSSSSAFIPPGETGHLFEIDFHVLQTAPVGVSTLLDLQGAYVDAGSVVRNLTIADFGNHNYGLTTTPTQYSTLQNLPILTHAGALSPAQFTPADTDTTDASIQIVAGAPKTPTAVADSYSMAPNNGNFGTTMAITGPANGVLGNDTATGNGPMNAILTGSGVSTVSTVPTSNAITSATETGNVVTIAMASTANLIVGEGVTITGVSADYNGSFTITSVDTAQNLFTYIVTKLGLTAFSTGTAATVATTVATANTSNGTVWLNERDGSFVYTPASGFSGTDTFTYQAEDAFSTAASPSATVTINVGGYINIPQNLTTTGIGDTVIVPVNILDPNPANSGGLANITVGINYDPSVFLVSNITQGAVIASWFSFTTNTSQAGQIIVTAADTGGAGPIISTTGGTLVYISFSVIGVPATGSTSVVNISGSVPAVSELDYVSNGTPVKMPLMVPPQDNTNFDGPPGTIDGLVTFQAPDIGTTTTVTAAVAGSPVSTVTYGVPVTLTATVAPNSGAAAPTAGSVDFKDGTTDLGTVNSETVVGTNAIFTLVTTVNQLQVITANGGVHNITATYIHGTGFNDSPAGTWPGGLKITPAPLSITATTKTKGYDSTTNAAATPVVTGLIGSDTVTGLVEVFANRNAGSSKTINVSAYAIQDGNGGLDYNVTTVANTTGVINKSALTLTALTNTKTYSASTAASAAPAVSGLIGGDTATGLAEAYADANVGSNKTLSVSAFTISDGNSGNNYTLTTVANTTGQITKAPLTITAAANTKTYDSTTSTAAAPVVTGKQGADIVTATEVYSDANVGTAKTLSISSVTVQDGNSGNNYTVTLVASAAGAINKAALTFTATTSTKAYDSTTGSFSTPIVSGLLGNDTVTGLTEVFANANAGTGKTLTVNAFTVNDGNGGGNYVVTLVTSATGSITKSALTIKANPNTKTYDATTQAASTPSVTGLLGNDTITGLAEGYVDGNAGSNKTLMVSTFTVNDGNGGGNYSVTTTSNTTGVISKATLTITAATNTKTYDSTTTAAATPGVSGLLGSDSVAGLAEVYSNANAATAKTLSVSTFTINDGNNGGNYALTTLTNATGVINRATLNVTALPDTKAYNATTTAATVPTISGLLGNDTVTSFAESYSSASAGANKILTPSGTVNDGNGGNNYLVTFVANSNGVITKANLTLTAQTNTKTYDSTTTAAATPAVTGLVGSDTITGMAEVYANANAATGKALSVSSYTVNDGNGGNNYSVILVSSATGVINKASLTITAQSNTKSYDATNSAAATPIVSGLLGNDTVTGLTEVYADGNGGTGKTLSVGSYTVNDGNGNNNYTITLATSAAGVINKSPLTITAASNTKVYDATTSAAAAPVVTGLLGSDTVTGRAEVYANANANTGKTLAVSAYTINDGNGGSNYTVTLIASATGVISSAPLTLTAVTNTKAYDGTTTAAATPLVAGLRGSNTVTGLTEVYANRSAGTGKTLSVSAFTVNDGNSGANYSVTMAVNTTGQINTAPLTISAVANTKVYDSTTAATAAPTVSGLLGSDIITGSAEVYTDAKAGSNKTLSVSAFTVADGNSGNNYTVTTATNTAGLINKALLTITAVFNSKVYNSTTTTVATPTVTGMIGNDSVTGPAEVYADPNAGSSKTLSVSAYTVSDGNSGNSYNVTTAANTTGVIGKAPLTITATTNTKNFDGTTSAAAKPTVTGLLGNDSTTGLAEVYADPSAGTGKTLSVSAYTINDSNSGINYNVTTATNATGAIAVTSVGTSASLQTSLASVTYGTSVTFTITVTALSGSSPPTGAVEVFDNGTHDLGAASAQTPVGTVTTYILTTAATALNVANPANHVITANYNATGNFVGSAATLTGGETVTPKALTFTATTSTKTYDATSNAAAAPTISGLVPGDSVTGLTEAFSDANVGTNKTLRIKAYTINDNNSGNNYSVTTVSVSNGTINKALLTITATTNTKTYDSTSNAAALPTIAGLQGADSVANVSESYITLNAGTSLTLSVNPGYTVNDGNGGGNYSVSILPNTTGIINLAHLTLTALTFSKTYDSTTAAGVAPTVTGLVGGDSVTNRAEVFSNTNAGSGKTLSVSTYTINDGNGGNNYILTTQTNTTGLITKASLTITALTNTKTYDSTTTAAAVPTVTGLLGGDSTSSLTEVFASANAGSGKTLNVNSYTVNDGNGGNNYAVSTVANTTGLISKAPLTITALTSTKTYTSTTTASVTPSVSGLQGGDTVTSLAEVYADATTGPGKTLNVSPYTIVDGNGGNNYAVSTVANTTGLITKASLTITATANTKIYDATTTAGATPIVSGLVGGDSVGSLTEVYADANAGTGKTLSIGSYNVLDGNAGNNYTVTTLVSAGGVVNKALLTITATTNTKTYDAKTTAAAAPQVSGLQGSDSVAPLTEVYSDVNAGQNKTLNIGIYTVNDGNSGNNYSVTTVVNTTGRITKAPLTITATTNTKTYDSTTASAAAPSVAGLMGADAVTGLAEVYANANAGTGKTLSIVPYSVSDGNGGNNYLVTTVTAASGVINKASLTITAAPNTKIYDSTTAAAVLPVASGQIGGDRITGMAEVSSDAKVGTGKTLSVSAYTVTDDNGGNNYSVTTVASAAGVINQAPLTITATTNTKTYDSTASAAAIPTVTGLIGNDAPISLTEVYADLNVGSSKTLSVSAYAISDGNGGNNYAVSTAVTTTGAIVAGPMVYSATTGTPTSYTLLVQGTNFEVVDASQNILASQPLANTSAIIINGHTAGSDALTLDYSGGDPLFNGTTIIPLTFNGGAANLATLNLKGPFNGLTYDATSPHSGDFKIQDTAARTGMVNFTGLAPINVNTTTTTLAINITDNSIGHTATFSAGPAGQDTVTFTGGLEGLTFNNPTKTLTVTGATVPDTFTFNSLDSGFNASLNVTGNSGGDITNLNLANLVVGSASASQAVTISTNTINLGGNIDATGAGTNTGSISLTGNVTLQTNVALSYSGANGLQISGPVNLAANKLTVDDALAADAGSISGALSGIGGLLTKSGPGTLKLLGGGSNYTGTTTIQGGKLQVGATNATSAASNINITASGTLDLDGNNTAVGSLSGSGSVSSSVTGAATLTVTGGGIFGGNIANGAGSVGLTVAGATQTLTLSGTANTYSGATTVNNSNILLAGGPGVLSPNSSITVNGTLDMAGNSIAVSGLKGSGTVLSSVAGAVTLTVSGGNFSGAIANGGGAVGLAVSAGTLILTGTNTYSGSTTISSTGTLQVDGSLTSTVTNSGRLQGTGTITGNVSGSNIFEPGDGDSSPGVLTINGNFTPTGILRIALGGTSAGTQYGQFNVSGNANLAAANLTLIRNYAPSGGDTFNIVTVGGASAVTPFTSLPDLHNVPFLPDNLTIHYPAHQVTLTDDYVTTTTVNVSLNGTPVSTIAVGTSVTLTATVVPAGGASPPTLGFVQFQDGGTSLGTVTTAATTGTSEVFTLITTPQQLQVILTNGGIHTVTAIYTSGPYYNGSQGTLAGGLQVMPIPLNITPAANLTSYTLTSDGVNLNVVDSSNNVLGGQPLVDTSEVNINAQSQGNTLTLDYNNGDPLFNGNNGIPLNFNGGAANQATLSIVGPLSVQQQQIDDITYDPSNPHAGNLLITDPNGNTGTVNFTGLAPILISTSLSTVTISVSDNSAPHTATFTAAPGMPGYNLVTFDGGLENMAFKSPSAALIVSGASMANTFNFVSLDSGFNAGLQVTGNSGNDITNLNIANLVVNAANAGGAGGGVIHAVTKGTVALGPTIDINTQTINLFGNIDATGGGTNNGSIELTGNVNLKNNVTLKYDGIYNPPAPALPAGLQINGPVNLGGSTLTAIDENATDTGIIVGALTGTGGALVKSGPGTLVLQGIGSSYTGTTTIQSGTLQVGVANATSPNSNFIDNGDLDLDGSSTIINSLSGSGEINSSAAGSATLTVDGGGNYSGDVNDENGSVGITVGGVGQTLVLSGTDNTYSGATTIGGSDTLKVGAPAATSANSSIFNNGTFDLSGFNTPFNGLSGFGVITNNAATPATFTSHGTGTFNGGIANGGSPLGLTVASGSLELAGTNSYTGPTAISAPATLQVDKSLTSNVNNSGNLRGQGTITGSVIGNGSFAPGNGIGTMTVNGNFTPTGGTVNIVINGTNALSRLVVNGAANLAGANLSVSGNASYVPAGGTVFTIISATSLTGTFNKLPDLSAVLLNGRSLTIHYATNGVTLTANYATTTTVSATVGRAAVTSVVYGTPVTLQATVAPPGGIGVAPTAGSVDFQDGTNDLGVATIAALSGTNSIFTLITTVNQLQVLTGSGSSHTITATYIQGTLFSPSSGTLANGLTVTPAPLTITALTQTKTYDATSAALAKPTVAGLVGNDTVTGLTEAFNNGNAASGKQLSVSSYTINDNNGGKDYAVTLVANAAGQITAAPLTIRATTSTKTYDATASSGATPTVSGLQGQDKVTNLGESFSDANAGSSKALTVNSGYAVNDGNSGSNYVVTTAADATGLINKAPLTITATTSTKTYNRSTGAGATPSVAGLLGVDIVSGLAEAFNDAKAGTGKTLSVVPGFVINDGNSGKNYAVTLSTDSTGVINKALLTIAAGTNTKTYDATTAAAATPALTGLIPGDTVTGMVEAYTDINAGSGKTLSVSTYSINDGNNGNNYLVTTVVAATGVITPAPLTIAAVTNIKTYDGTKAAATTPTVVGLLGNDSVANRAEAYVSANAGLNQTLSVTAYTINDGAGGNNYAVTTLTAATGVINKASLLIAATTSTKIYDSKTIAAATPTVAGLIGSDSVTGLSESYISANAGAGKSLIVNAGYTVSDGNGGNNYTVATLADVTGSITRAPLTLTATANTKVYDSKTTAAALPVASGLIGSDTISGLSETYSSANTGTGKVLNVNSAYTVQDSNGGNNYAVTTVPSNAGQITKAPLTITAITSTITYNATTTTGAIPAVSGLIGGDSVSGLAESFIDPGLGTGKTLSVNPGYSVSDGNNGNNYTVATATNATGAIIPGPVNKFVVTIPGSTTVVAGVPFNFTIQAADFYGNPVVNYAGPITASTNIFDPLGSFPISGPLQVGSIGYGFFLGILKTTGTYTVNISAAGGIAGASVPITVIPAATSYFSVTTAPSTITGAPINVTVSAFDSYSNINYNYNGTIKLSSSDGSALVGGNYTFTTGPGHDNGAHTFSVTLKTPGTQFITALDVNTPTLSNTSVGTLARGLQVTSVTPTATGFTIAFDKSFIPGDITLYGASASAVADVVLTAKSGNKQIHGSILVDPSNQSLTFKATSNYLLELNASATPAAVSAVLPDDTYTITILSGSGSNGFIDALGAHLDGASNNGGANYTTTFTTNYQANATPVLGIPDFARGPDANAPIQVPTTGAGIPITLYNAANVTDVTFSLSYNSALLNLTGTLSGSSGTSDATSATASLVLVSNAGGVATFHYTDTAPHSATPLQPLVLGDLTATVPSANFAISSITESGNVVTVATSSNENFSAGQSIAINGVTNSVYDSNTHGNGLFTIVNTISANRFTINLPVANQAPSSGGVAGVAALGLYQQKDLLQPGNIIINKGAITGATSSSGIHVNSYIGDVNGDGVIDGLDKIAANNVAQGKSTGLSSYAQLDPAIVGDPANDFNVDAGDVTTIDSFVAGLSPTQIPVPPTQLPGSSPFFFPKADLSSPNASDPTLSLKDEGGRMKDESNNDSDSSFILPPSSFVVSVNIDHPDPEGSTGLNAASLALTFDPAVLTVTADDIILGSIPSRGSGWQLSAVVDQATGQIGIQLYSSTPITTNQGGSLVNIVFHPLASSERRGVSPPALATTTVQLVNSATPNGQHFDTGLTDSQSGMILSPGIDQVEVPTGVEPLCQPAFASATMPTDAKAGLDQPSLASMFPGPFQPTESKEPTASALLANGSAADQATVPHQAPANLVVAGALAFQPSRDVLATRPWDVQVIQIAASPEFASRPAQPIVDRLFQALAQAREAAGDLSLLAPIWDAFSQLDWLEVSSVAPNMDKSVRSDAASTLGTTDQPADSGQIFDDLESGWSDFGNWSGL